MKEEFCVRCHLPEGDQRHNSQNPPREGWHVFRGQSYVDAIEDALLFVREKNQPHEWAETGVTIDTSPSFSEKRCKVCGAINWGGKEAGVCFGIAEAENALVAAHNRGSSRQKSRK